MALSDLHMFAGAQIQTVAAAYCPISSPVLLYVRALIRLAARKHDALGHRHTRIHESLCFH